jgi:hypothetical protein
LENDDDSPFGKVEVPDWLRGDSDLPGDSAGSENSESNSAPENSEENSEPNSENENSAK